MSSSKVVLVTGGNQGLGFAILQVAALRNPSWTFLLGSRDVEKGTHAIQCLRDMGIRAQFDVLHLDVTKDSEVSAAAEKVSSQYGRLDVLVNNAGIIQQPPVDSLSSMREAYNSILNVNISSVAVVTAAFSPLLYKSASPKVINISSGLGSIQNALTKKMVRAPAYGASKIGMNGLTVHLQVAENDRLETAQDGGKPLIRYFACAPGLLKTAFTKFNPKGRSPEQGAEVAVVLMADDEGKFQGGTFWEFEEGQMRQVPW